MTALSTLSKPAWDAALNAARVLRSSNPHNADDRASFRDARDRLAALLPADTDTRPIVTEAVRWDSMNEFALTFAGLSDNIARESV